MEQMRERVARAICSISDPVDSSNWRLYLDEADAALSLMQPEIDRRVAEEKARLLERLCKLADAFPECEADRDLVLSIVDALEKEQQP